MLVKRVMPTNGSAMPADEPFYAQYLVPPVIAPIIEDWLAVDDNPESFAAMPDTADHIQLAQALGTTLGTTSGKIGVAGTMVSAGSAASLIFGLAPQAWSVVLGIGGLLVAIVGLGHLMWYRGQMLVIARENGKIDRAD